MTTTRIVAGTAALVVLTMQMPNAYALGQAGQPVQAGQTDAVPPAPVEASAQPIVQAAAEAPAPQQTTVTTGSADNGGLQEVIVTATKRSTALLKTPIAMTALTAQALDDAHVKNLEDLTHLTPSFQATAQGDHAVLLLTMRGIGNDGAKTEQADPEVSVYVDGVYSPRAEGATTLLYDMDRVEVMRGPQGTLWGRNSTAGAVNMVTAKPKFGEAEGSAELALGSYSRVGSRLTYNLPVSDTVALRLAYAAEEHAGYVDYQTPPDIPGLNKNAFVTSGPKYNSQDQKALRLSAAWQPSQAFRWDLSFETFRDNGTPQLNLNQEPRPGQSLWSALIQVAPQLYRKVDSLRTRADWSITPDVDLALIGGAQRTDGSSQFDGRAGYTVPTSDTTGGIVRNTRIGWEHYTNASAEINLKSSGKKTVDWLLGAYYFHERAAIRLDQPAYSGTQAGYGCLTCGWPALTSNSFYQPSESVKSSAFFTQNTWNVSDALRLTGGVRETWDEKRNKGGVNYYCPTVQPNGQACIPISASDLPWEIGYVPNPSVIGPDGKPATSNSGEARWKHATWLVKADYDLSKDVMVYGSVGTGYKSGVLTDGGVHTRPETLISHELGAKGKAFGGKMTWSLAAYYADFKDYQVSIPTTFPNGSSFLLTANAKGAIAKGLEAELRAKLTPDDTLQLALAAQRTEMDTLLTSDADVSTNNNITVPGTTQKVRDLKGNELPHSPHFSATVGYEHKFNLPNGARLMPRLITHYETSSWLDIFNDGAPDQQKAYTRTDVTVRYQPADRKWALEAFVQNLENDDIKSNVNIVNVTPATSALPVWQAIYLPPRTYGARLTVDF
jgi:iron complex outermembrane receptor protein